MFAINHAATALLVKRKYPAAPMLLLLVSVQLMEFLWVAFNYLGLEQATTEPVVRSVSDIHLAYIPYSHSIASGIGLGVLAWFIFGKLWHKPVIGWAACVGAVSHLILDLITHAPDIAIAPGISRPMFGLGLYASVPLLAFFLELAYGAFCWWIYRGGGALLAAIVLFNLGNLSFLSSRVPGPEEWLAGRPLLIVTIIAIQIAVTLALVGVFSSRRNRSRQPA